MERNRAVGKLTARSYHPLKTEPWVGSKYVDKCDFIRMNNVSRSGGGESTHQSTKPIWEPHRFNIPVLHPKVNHLKLKAFFQKLPDHNVTFPSPILPSLGQSSKVGKQSCQENSRHRNTCRCPAFRQHVQIVATPSPDTLSRFTMVFIQCGGPWIAKLVQI